MASGELQVVSGAVIACRLFDIADSIDLATAESLWGQQPRAGVDPRPIGDSPIQSRGFRRRPAGYPARDRSAATGWHRALGWCDRPALRLWRHAAGAAYPADDLSGPASLSV